MIVGANSTSTDAGALTAGRAGLLGAVALLAVTTPVMVVLALSWPPPVAREALKKHFLLT